MLNPTPPTGFVGGVPPSGYHHQQQQQYHSRPVGYGALPPFQASHYGGSTAPVGGPVHPGQAPLAASPRQDSLRSSTDEHSPSSRAAVGAAVRRDHPKSADDVIEISSQHQQQPVYSTDQGFGSASRQSGWVPEANGSARATSLRFVVDSTPIPPQQPQMASVVPVDEHEPLKAGGGGGQAAAPVGPPPEPATIASAAAAAAASANAEASSSSSLASNGALTPRSAAKESTMGKVSWTQAPRILVVEDDIVYRQLSSKFLQRFGCIVETAENAQQGIEKMNETKYDLVLMDIFFGPSMDGRKATSLIRQFDILTPIISMTSSVQTGELGTFFIEADNQTISPRTCSRV